MKNFWLIVGSMALLSALIVTALFPIFGSPVEPEYRGKKLTAWLDDLDSRSAITKTDAKMAIQHIGTNAVPFLVQMLYARDSRLKIRCMDLLDRQHWVYFRFHNAFEQRIAACQALAILGPDAKAAIPDLTNELNEFVFGWSAAYALSQIGPPAAPVLMNALTNSVPWVRADAAFGLGALGEPSSASNLLAVLKDSEWTTRSSAVDALQAFPDQASLIVPALVNSLDDPNYVVQVHVERALGSFGPTARPAFPKLLHMIASTNDIASRDAAIALVKIDFDGAFIAFTNNLNSSDIQVRRTTVLALMYFKSTGEPAVPRLIKCLNDPDVTVRAHAAIALGAIGKDPDLAVPALMANLNDPDPAVQVGAAMALRSFGARAKPAVPQILRIINENKRNHYTVRSLYKALADIDPETAAKYPHRNP